MRVFYIKSMLGFWTSPSCWNEPLMVSRRCH